MWVWGLTMQTSGTVPGSCLREHLSIPPEVIKGHINARDRTWVGYICQAGVQTILPPHSIKVPMPLMKLDVRKSISEFEVWETPREALMFCQTNFVWTLRVQSQQPVHSADKPQVEHNKKKAKALEAGPS